MGRPTGSPRAPRSAATPSGPRSSSAHRSGVDFALRARPWHGWVLALAIAALAYAAQHLPFAPFRMVTDAGVVRHPVGPAIIAIVLGVAIRNLLRVPEPITIGSRSLVRWSIPWAIVLIGAGLNLAVVAGIGLPSLAVIGGAILIAMTAAILAGRALRLRKTTSLLLAAGTAICGNSAILAVAPIIKARDRDMLVSIGVVNLIGLVFMVLLPYAGAMLAMSPEAFGVWAGASIHSVPQAVAAGFAYPIAPVEPGGGAGEVATLVKLVRVAMLVPLVIAITLIVANGQGGLRSINPRGLVPWYIWGFIALAAANTIVHSADHFPAALAAAKDAMSHLNLLGGILLTISLAAIGLDVDLRQLAQVGRQAVLVGVIASVAMTAGCFALILAMM